MGDTSETNTKVLSRELFLGVVALKRLYLKIIICATRTLFSGTVTYISAILDLEDSETENENRNGRTILHHTISLHYNVM